MSYSSQENKKTEITTLAGGCFWGMEELIRSQKGILHTEVGYAGGASAAANYEMVKTGKTGHAEAIRIEFDPTQTSFENLLLFFFKIHDPTTQDSQGNDIGTQYRSAIFYHSEMQKDVALQVIARVNRSKAWGKEVVTQLISMPLQDEKELNLSSATSTTMQWHKAEEYHQDYLQKNPRGYTCHFIRKIEF